MRTFFAVSIAALAALAPFALVANAGPAPTTTVTLACDHNADATAIVELKADSSSPALSTVMLSCGPNSERGVKNDRLWVAREAPFATGSITVLSAPGSPSCPVETPLPGKASCDPAGNPGARLTIR